MIWWKRLGDLGSQIATDSLKSNLRINQLNQQGQFDTKKGDKLKRFWGQFWKALVPEIV